MNISFTTLSQNGQVVIPSEIRKNAGLKPSTKFLVFNEGGSIMLKQIRTDSLRKEMELLERIQQSEDEIKQGRVVKADTTMSDDEIDDLLMQ